jgi:hypothetical protein
VVGKEREARLDGRRLRRSLDGARRDGRRDAKRLRTSRLTLCGLAEMAQRGSVEWFKEGADGDSNTRVEGASVEHVTEGVKERGSAVLTPSSGARWRGARWVRRNEGPRVMGGRRSISSELWGDAAPLAPSYGGTPLH